MSLEVVSPRMRGFLCTNAHPGGCAASVRRQVAVAGEARNGGPRGGNALVIGASTGYGLASRVAASFGHGMATVGVFLERGASGSKTGSAGWYNSTGFHAEADRAGLKAASFNADAFSNETRRQVLDRIGRDFGPIDLVVYSLASPVRTHPDTGVQYRSTLKPIGRTYTTKTLDLEKERVFDITLEAATQEEIDATVAVMGGDDLNRWIGGLLQAGLVAKGARVTAYSYIGPELTWAIYKDGTIGRAKADIKRTCDELNQRLQAEVGGNAWVAVDAAVVTQASTAIPAVPLYLSLFGKVAGAMGIKEEPIHQMVRLFNTHLGRGVSPTVDAEGMIRMDDLEMRPEVQADVLRRWSEARTENIRELADLDGLRSDFQQLFGFGVPGVDYSAPTEIDAPLPV